MKQEAQNPLILRCHRLMEAFAKADDERDFYLNRNEGFILYVDLDKTQEELDALYQEINTHHDSYCQIPKLTFYETKKIMEGFVNEKVYDIDTKEKLLDIIQSKEARENFLEFVYDHHSEFEKWQQFYQERSRIRIIEWLRHNHFHFVFEEDLDLAKNIVEKLKLNLFQTKVGKDILTARKSLFAKAKTYYSNEALNPRPKRGRPPKQTVKQEVEPQMTSDIYLSISSAVRPFLFTPEHNTTGVFSFSSKFENEEMLANRRQPSDNSMTISEFNNKLASLRSLSSSWVQQESEPQKTSSGKAASLKWDVEDFEGFDDDEDDDDDDFNDDEPSGKKTPSKGKLTQKTLKPVVKSEKSPAKAPAKTAKIKPAIKTPPKGAKSTKAPATPSTQTKGRPKGSTKKKRIIPTNKK